MPKESHTHSLAFHFSSIDDPRMDRTKEHLLSEILLIALCAMLCGAEGFVDFQDFGKARREWLRSFLELPGGIPSHDTFRRVFAMLDPKAFSDCFRNWTQSLRTAIGAEIVAIDGKTLRRSHHRSKGKEAIHMVSAWARENGLVLGQLKVDDKSNEPSGARQPKGGAFARRAAPEGAGKSRPFPSCCGHCNWQAALRLCSGP